MAMSKMLGSMVPKSVSKVLSPRLKNFITSRIFEVEA